MGERVAASALVPRLAHTWSEDNRDQLIEGTAVVVDISGFTALSEQLASIGREGTEQLIATLSRVFTVLMPATDDGADVVKFAGDALFLLFRGADHAKHAVHAAWNMNRVLGAIGDIHLPSARVKLRMSVGVHSGAFAFHLTGSRSLGIVMSGPAVDRVLELQSAAPAGRILVSAETAALLPGAQTKAEGDAYRLLRAGSVALSSFMSLSSARARGAERFLPQAFSARPDLLGGEPDHRWAAIAFVQVSGLTGDDSERKGIDALTRAVEDATSETGVTLLDIDPAVGGYRYFLTAGAPTAVEDPEGRLITAVTRIVAAGDGLSVRAGVTSGRIFAGFVGAAYRQTYTVMGDPTNLAARLTARAEPGTVLASIAALARSATPFETTDAGAVTVKGKTEPISVAVVTGGGIRRNVQTAPFHGRVDELRQLREAIAAAESGAGAAATIVGDPGIGKSRLLEEAVSGCAIPVIRVTGDRYAVNRPYRVMHTLLRPLLDIPSTAEPEEAGRILARFVESERRSLARWLPLLAPFLEASVEPTEAVSRLDDEFRADRAHAALGELLDVLLPDPVCIVVDDAQWVDAASAAALADFAAAHPPHALLVARRAEDGGLDALGNVVDLPPLDDESAERLIEGIMGRALLPSDLAALVRRGAGNALFLSELASATGSEEEKLGVEQLVGERIDRLGERDRSLVRRAAVLGSRVALKLFERCVEQVDEVDWGAIAGMLELAEDGVAFRSDLFREIAYSQLPFQSRRDLHAEAAAVIRADPSIAGGSPDAALMIHCDAAGEPPAARDAALLAAEAATTAFALDEAVAAYRVAMRAAHAAHDPGAEILSIAERLAAVALDCGRAEEALEVLIGARPLATDAAARTRVDRGRAHALTELGRHKEAERTLAAARRSARSLGESGAGLHAAVVVRETALALWRADWQTARRLTLEAITLLEGRDLNRADKGVLADAYRYHDIAAGELEGDGAMLHLQKALEIYDELGDEEARSKVLSLTGVRAYYRGEWSVATRAYAQGQAAAEAAGDVVGAEMEAINQAEILVDQGRLDEAFAMLRRARHTFEGSGNPYLIGFTGNYLARAEMRAGRPREAREGFIATAELLAETQDRDSLLDVSVRRVEAEVSLGQEDEAHALIDGLLTREDLPGVARSRLLRQRGRMLRRAGATPRAIEVTEAALTASADAPYDRALCLAQLAAWMGSSGSPLRQEAREIFLSLGVVDTPALLRDPALSLDSQGGESAGIAGRAGGEPASSEM